MLKASRSLCLDICDYENNIICNLFDNTTDISGQAHDVFVRTERNGWKELTFKIPSTCFTVDGEEENFRLQFLIADYRIRLKTETETDWYLISEAKITHDKKSKNVEVTAGHIAQLLKTKSLDLEFSDEEGNNTGTAEQILTTILEGTGWTIGHVAEFYENDGTTIKKRSLNASTNTGAFRLIEDLCDLFDAKPIYHGDERVVDIVPMNPFSKELEPGEIPEEVFNDLDVLEIHYDKNLKNIVRTVNTETMVTRLYAYGSYGDENGMCSIQTCSHEEYLLSSGDYPARTEFKFVDDDGAAYYFMATDALTSSSELVFSKLDFMSRSYVWNKTTGKAYHVYKTRKGSPTPLPASKEIKKNYFPFLLNFDYYNKTGLLTENMFQRLAAYQQNMPEYYIQSETSAKEMIANEQLLSETLESNTGMAKLAVRSYGSQDGKLVLNLDTTKGDHGVLYRTDYDEAKRNYFEWHIAKQLKDNGDPLTGIGSVVYIVHNTDPVTWEIAYVKNIMDDNGNIYVNGQGEPKDFDYGLEDTEPGSIAIWLDKGDLNLSSDDRFYLFCSMSMSGRLSAKQVADEAVLMSLQNETTIQTEKHPTFFAERNEPAPSTTPVQGSYGWYYKYSNNTMDIGELYFCYGSRGENSWHRVYLQETEPNIENDAYFFNLKTKALYHGVNGGWIKMETAEDQRTAIQFSKVAYYCRRRDMIYHGLYEKYSYTPNFSMTIGNYAFKSPYEFFWVATTDKNIPQNSSVTVDTVQGLLWQDDDIQNVVSTKVVSYEAADFPVSNELDGLTYFPGKINSSTGVEEDSTGWYRTINIKGYETTVYQYNLPDNSYIVCYNINKVFKGVRSASGTGTFTTYGDTYYLRVVTPSQPGSSHYLRIKDYSDYLYLSNKPYRILDFTGYNGELVGINPLMKKFANLADTVFEVNYASLIEAQNAIKAADNELTDRLGDLLREGYWQEDNFVEGDEDRLYNDAIDNLKEISKPETTYDISYIDLYSANRNQNYAVEELYDVDWPDIQITDAIHLVDPEIEINQWAYIDVINKCYDHPWDTTLEINTKLSLINQHDFTDVLARIAEVANETKAKQSVYKRAAALSSVGTLSSELLKGNIKANKALILGGSSNWYTDQKGNIVFEATDGSGALMLTGHGILVASDRDSWGDWNWRTGITGKGISSDEVVTAFLSAKEALIGTITTDMIHASVGQELDIGSNRALMLYATVSGERPAGGVKTGLHNADGSYSEVGPDDSYIQIGAKETTGSGVNPAYINIMTGGQMNVYAGSDMNIKSGADLFVESKGHFEVQSGGDMKIASGGSIDIVASEAGHFTVTSPNFNIAANGDTDITGKVTALTGEVAGLTISYQENAQHKVIRRFMYAGTDSMTSASPGVYIGTDGVNLGGYLTVSKDGATAKFGTNTMKIDAVAGTMDINGGSINVSADSTINITSGKKMKISSTGAVEIGTSGKLFTVGSNKTNAYIYNGRSTVNTTNVDGCYFGTDGLNIGKASGSYVIAKPDGTIDISGKITASSGSIGGINVNSSYGIYTGAKTSATSTESGFLISKDGAIYLGAYSSTAASCPFQVSSAGAMTAKSGSIAGWTFDATSLKGNKTGIAKTSADKDIAFWAGNTTASSANFYVRQDGYLVAKDIHASGGNIGTWSIGPKLLSASSGTSYVALDGSADLYPLSGLSTPSDHMYAIWAGASSPQDAPFSVTKDGIVTISKLRIKKADDSYDEVSLNDFTYTSVTGDLYDWKKLFAKLRFQTVRSISQDSNGRVTIRVSNNNGGIASWSFNTAASVTTSGSWNSGSKKFTAMSFYKYGGKDIQVGDLTQTDITCSWLGGSLFVFGNIRTPKLIETQLYQFVLSANNPGWGTDHKKTYTVSYTVDGTTASTGLKIEADASSVYKGGHDNGAKSVTLKGAAASSSDTVNKSLGYGDKWIIQSKYFPSDTSIESNTGAKYVVQAPSDNKKTGWDLARKQCVTPEQNTTSASFKVLWPGESYDSQGRLNFTLSKGSGNTVDCKWGSTTVARVTWT